MSEVLVPVSQTLPFAGAVNVTDPGGDGGGGDGGGLGDIADDPSPQLGGNLDINGNDITGTGNITHTGNITTTGNNSISGTLGVSGVTTFSADDVIFTGNTSNLTWDASANDLEFDDNSRLKLGTGGDFQIWHGGTHTFMKNNTGELRIRGDIISLERADDTEKYLEANVNEDVKLFYNGNEKIATTNTGINVTGDAKVGTGNSTGVILTSPDGTEYRLIVANGGALSTSAV